MLKAIACLAGVFFLLVLAEVLWHNKILKGENQRKFVHITVGSFVAFWPWLISWKAIQIIAVAMFVVVIINRNFQIIHPLGGRPRKGIGESLYALVILMCALLTTNKVFFAIAILQLALADGVAAVVGKNFGKKWQYKVLGQTKTVFGTMAFWLVSLGVLGTGTLLAAHDMISFNNYAILIIALPPALTLLENFAFLGLDNLVIPVVTLLALHLAQV